MECQADIRGKVPTIIRESSCLGRLVTAEEIVSALRRQELLGSESMEIETAFQTVLREVVPENPDLIEIVGQNGIFHYYSTLSMSETYARILLCISEDPMRLIAEVVRDNSRLYPRPISIDGFSEPPFDLTRESILKCLEAMGEDTEYRDISKTTTSIGRTFLYSNRHLDPDYAAMLAEWSDVGQADNP